MNFQHKISGYLQSLLIFIHNVASYVKVAVLGSVVVILCVCIFGIHSIDSAPRSNQSEIG